MNKYKVTRTWVIKAKTIDDAIQNTRIVGHLRSNHYEVTVKLLKKDIAHFSMSNAE